MRMIFSSGRPAILRHSAAASSSSANTVISRRSLIEREILRQQLPGEQDRALLEVIAEGEIAEHLEEGVVARGVADIVEIVVLAAGAHAFLRRRRAQGFRLLGAGEHVLERHHAGIGEHQRRVVARHERRRRHDHVVVLGEEIEKGRADVVGARAGEMGMAHAAAARAGRRRGLRLPACGLAVSHPWSWRRSWQVYGRP